MPVVPASRGPATSPRRSSAAGSPACSPGKRLKQAGIDDVRIVDKAGDFGGTWYWNATGAQCDTASFVYMPLLEETGHMPTEKYAHARDPRALPAYRQAVQPLRALFHTEVTGLRWDEAASRWIVETDRGDPFTATYLAMGTGPLHVAKLPGIPGVDSFRGHAFHQPLGLCVHRRRARRHAPMDRLADKRVASSAPARPPCSASPTWPRPPAGSTSSSGRRRRSTCGTTAPPTPTGSRRSPRRAGNAVEDFAANQSGALPGEDLVQDGWTDLARRVLSASSRFAPEDFTPEKMMEAFEDSDFEKMEEIRTQVDSVVDDQDLTQKLKALVPPTVQAPVLPRRVPRR